jgi:hypothetical protein
MCAEFFGKNHVREPDMSVIKDALDRHRARLMEIESVIGVAIGRSSQDPEGFCIVVYTRSGQRPSDLPEEIEGFPVEVQLTSEFRAR